MAITIIQYEQGDLVQLPTPFNVVGTVAIDQETPSSSVNVDFIVDDEDHNYSFGPELITLL